MKKMVLLLVTALMLTGCGSSANEADTESDSKSSDNASTASTTTTTPTYQDTFNETGLPEEDTTSDEPEIPEEPNYLKRLDVIPIPAEKNAGLDLTKYYAFVKADKELTKSISEQASIDLCTSGIKATGSKYFTIDFQDHTGIVFSNSVTELAMYGKIDEFGCMLEAYKYIEINEDGTITISE